MRILAPSLILALTACTGPSGDTSDTDDTQTSDQTGDTDNTTSDQGSDDADDTDVATNDADQDGSPTDEDCDDNDPLAYPGATEIFCDGTDQDCDTQDATGQWILATGAAPLDVSATLTAGTPATPATLSLTDATLRLCGGEFYVAIAASGTSFVEGHSGTILHGGTATAVVSPAQDAVTTVSGVTLSGAAYATVYLAQPGTLNLDNAVLTTVRYGVACAAGCDMNLVDTTVQACTEGGLRTDSGTLHVTGGQFDHNGGYDGGAIMLGTGTLDIDGTAFSSNSVSGYGGAVYANSSTIDIRNASFTGNSANWGGALMFPNCTVNLTDSTFTANTVSQGGGGVHAGSGTVTVSGCTFEANTASGYGGGLMTEDVTQSTVTGTTFDANTAPKGGGWWSKGPATATDDVFSGNTADDGGGLYIYSGSATLTGGSFTGNTGSGVQINSCSSDLTITNVTFGTGANANTGGGVLDVSGDTFEPTSLTCTAGECAGGTDLCGSS